MSNLSDSRQHTVAPPSPRGVLATSPPVLATLGTIPSPPAERGNGPEPDEGPGAEVKRRRAGARNTKRPCPQQGPGWETVIALAGVLVLLRAGLPVLPVPAAPAMDIGAALVFIVVVVLLCKELSALACVRPVLAALTAIVLGSVAYSARRACALGIGDSLSGTVGDIALVLCAALAGTVLSFIAREPNLLPPIAATAAAVDMVGVLTRGGFTARVLESHPEVVQALATTVPDIGAASTAVGAGLHGVQPSVALAFVGLGDILFLGFFFAAVARFSLDRRWSTVGALAACVLAMALVLTTAGQLPGLPFIVLGCLLPNVRRFRYNRQEVLMLAVGALVVTAICAALVAVGHAARN